MAVAIEGIDIVALCAVIVLIGLTLATQYTFQKLADAINISIVGTHPFASVSRTIEGTIVHWCAVGAKALEGVANDLWRGLTWSIAQTLQALMSIARDVSNAVNYVVAHVIADKIEAALAPINKAINAVAAKIGFVEREISSEVVRLDAKIETTARAVASTASHDLHTAISDVEKELAAGLHTLQTTVATDIRQAISTAEGVGQSALDKLRSAEDAAIGAIKKAETATAAELRDLINSTPLDQIEGLLIAVPALAAIVNVLEAETGLGRAECRGKIKNICATDPAKWAGLLDGLALIGVGLSLEQIFRLSAEVADEAISAFREVTGV